MILANKSEKPFAWLYSVVLFVSSSIWIVLRINQKRGNLAEVLLARLLGLRPIGARLVVLLFFFSFLFLFLFLFLINLEKTLLSESRCFVIFKCSRSCGKGLQKREVKCLSPENQSNEYHQVVRCDEDERPVSRRICNDYPCKNDTHGSENVPRVSQVQDDPEIYNGMVSSFSFLYIIILVIDRSISNKLIIAFIIEKYLFFFVCTEFLWSEIELFQVSKRIHSAKITYQIVLWWSKLVSALINFINDLAVFLVLELNTNRNERIIAIERYWIYK